MKCIRCGVEIADRHPTTHEPEFCSDECENGDSVAVVLAWMDRWASDECEPDGDDCR